MRFNTLSELHKVLIYSAAKLGFRIIARDGTKTEKSPVHLTLTAKQIQLIQTLKKNQTSSKLITRIFNEIFNENITLTWRKIRTINKRVKGIYFNSKQQS